MIGEFLDQDDRIVHHEFQEWRRLHPSGYFLTFLTKRKARLHETLCIHSGNVDWTFEDIGASLTTRRKVCDETETNLLAWAAGNGIAVVRCADCLRHPPQRL